MTNFFLGSHIFRWWVINSWTDKLYGSDSHAHRKLLERNVSSFSEDITVNPMLGGLEVITCSITLVDNGGLKRLEIYIILMRSFHRMIFQTKQRKTPQEKENPDEENKL